MAKQLVSKTETVTITEIKTRGVIFNIVGTTPFYMHRFAFKAWQQLLLPPRKKNRAERETSLKHDPVEEFRGACYRNRNPKAPALFHIPSGMIHQAIAAAALDMPGATRAAIERLVSVSTLQLDLYGIPYLKVDMVRSSDMNRTPDVRTRPLFPRWAVKGVCLDYKVDPLNDSQLLNLVGAAGVIVGIGDNRPQKGGPNGKFRLAAANDKELADICAKEGREAQQKAWDNPPEYDEETAELLSWYNAEIASRANLDEDHTEEGAVQ